MLYEPWSVFVSNGEVFLCETFTDRARKLLANGDMVYITGGENETLGDGKLATLSRLYGPMAIVVSSSNQVYISEGYNHRIRKINRNGILSTIAGNGEEGYNGDGQLATDAKLRHPRGLFVSDEDEVYFCDCQNHRVRKIDRFGMISTVAGNGQCGYNGDDQLATSAQLSCPTGVFVHRNEIYISESENNRIRKVLQNGNIITIAGTGQYGFNGDGHQATRTTLSSPLHCLSTTITFTLQIAPAIV